MTLWVPASALQERSAESKAEYYKQTWLEEHQAHIRTKMEANRRQQEDHKQVRVMEKELITLRRQVPGLKKTVAKLRWRITEMRAMVTAALMLATLRRP